jgi:catechol 2,3-dioxygenase-like lactoylglutathione lyase family enzyme
MLSQAKIHATIPAQDLARARTFYEAVLGLKPASVAPGGIFYEVDKGSRFLLFPSSGRASGGHTQLGFTVDNLEAEVGALRQKGVTFESYDMPQFDTECRSQRSPAPGVPGSRTTRGTCSGWFR